MLWSVMPNNCVLYHYRHVCTSISPDFHPILQKKKICMLPRRRYFLCPLSLPSRKHSFFASTIMSFLYSDAVALRGAYFGEGRGPIMMEGVYCEGDEKGLHRCFQTHSQPCSHIQDAAVRCSGLHDCKLNHKHTQSLFLSFWMWLFSRPIWHTKNHS